MRTFVIGDIHGQHKALVGCLKACAFDYEVDRLIVLGDVCDRGAAVKDAIDELRKLRHCIFLRGNHDVMALEWATSGAIDDNWLSQGGDLTVLSYGGGRVPAEHIDFIKRGRTYFEEAGRLFVHAGFDPLTPIDQQPEEILIWDRGLVRAALEAHQAGKAWFVPGYREVFVGHTPTPTLRTTEPLLIGNLWLMDTGAGYGRRLTVLEVETKEFWQARAVE